MRILIHRTVCVVAAVFAACSSPAPYNAGTTAAPDAAPDAVMDVATGLPDAAADAVTAVPGDAAPSDTPTPPDTAGASCGALVGRYDPCTCTAQCPAGTQCVAPFAGIGTFCSPDCAGADATPCDPAASSPTACFAHHCGLYCDVAGFVTRCASTCIPSAPGSRDGLCQPSGPVRDAGTTDSGLGCAPVTNDGAVLTWGTSPSSPPAQSGGTITPGHYVLLSAVTYLAGGVRPPPPTVQGAMDVTPTTVGFAWGGMGIAAGAQTDFQYTASGSMFVAAHIPCSRVMAPPQTLQYSATATQVVLVDPGPGLVVNGFGAYQTAYTFQLH